MAGYHQFLRGKCWRGISVARWSSLMRFSDSLGVDWAPRCCPAKIWGILACAKWTLERVAPAKPLFLFAIFSRFSGDDGDATRKRPRMKDETCNILQELQSYHDHWCNWALLPLCTGISLVQCGRNMLSLAAEKTFRSYQSFPIQLEVMNQAFFAIPIFGDGSKPFFYHLWGRTIH